MSVFNRPSQRRAAVVANIVAAQVGMIEVLQSLAASCKRADITLARKLLNNEEKDFARQFSQSCHRLEGVGQNCRRMKVLIRLGASVADGNTAGRSEGRQTK
jgi:hypothetical protein